MSVLCLLKGELAKADQLLEENIAISLHAGDWVGAAATLRCLGSLCVLRGQLHRACEYGIPAVLGTGVATKRIRNGKRITVDGSAGTVTLN